MNADRATERRAVQGPGSSAHMPAWRPVQQGKVAETTNAVKVSTRDAQGQTGLRSLYTLTSRPTSAAPGRDPPGRLLPNPQRG